ncbi:MAG: FG-GAP-like repeat-containing protein [Pirellulaceae bacterium]|jgi:hypothetical protein|nr:FG-GAP-like repeat-containing protein [Pirellulaceae bacterium]
MSDTLNSSDCRLTRAVSLRVILISATCLTLAVPGLAAERPWRSLNSYRLLLKVDSRGVSRSNSPAAVDVDFVRALSDQGISGTFDEHTIEVIAYDRWGVPKTFDASRAGYERYLLPWRLEKYYGIDKVALKFVLLDETCTDMAVYFDTIESGVGSPQRYRGLVGDGDFFRQEYGRRSLGANHFDTFCDFDGDGDLDLFTGGVEPFIYCYENTGENRLVYRGRLTSAGKLLSLPKNDGNNRSWVLPHFHDWDGDGDQDFFPSFMDGPYFSKVAFFENTTPPDGQLTFVDRGVLKTASGAAVAGPAKAGVWFPSLVFVKDFDGDRDGRTDVLLSYNNRCYLHRNLGPDGSGGWRLDEAIAIKAGGEEIGLFNPCFEVADIDEDGDWDLFGAAQSGQVYLYQNVDTTKSRKKPIFAKGTVIAGDANFLVAGAHPRVTAADFTGDGLLDLAIDNAWGLVDLDNVSQKRVFGELLKNVGTATSPKWQKATSEGEVPFTETFQACDALRQNVVRAVDWNNDGRTDLLASDCDGFVWYFRNLTNHLSPLFAEGRRLSAGGKTLSLAGSAGHARHDVCDWNNDGRKDLVASDGNGTVTVYLNEGADTDPVLGRGKKVMAYDVDGKLKPIERGTRSHLMVCDFNHDGKKDLVFSDQNNPGFYFLENVHSDADPRFAPARQLKLSPYQRPNLGSFVDWDGDGKNDLIACEFEHSIRFYKDEGTGGQGAEPKFSDPDGITIVKPDSIMMISGADAVDWNQDGDLDIITGQGHAGSRLRFYERDYIEDSIHDTHPIVHVDEFQRAEHTLLAVVRRYADAMIEHGRDSYGPQQTGLLLSALDRSTLKPLELRPEPPGGVRRGDRVGLPWRRLTGANPHLDQNLLRVLYALTEITGKERYGKVADHEVQWFFQNSQSPVTGLLPWGEHLSWDVILDQPISSGTDYTHEFARPWVLWDRSFALAPKASKKFAIGLWNHQIADHQTGAFDRHAPYDKHGPRDGRDFPRHAGFYIHTWAHAYKHTGDEIFLRAIEVVLSRFERKRKGTGGVMQATISPLDIETAASMVPNPLAPRLREFAQIEDQLVLENLHQRYGSPDGTLTFKPNWEAGYASGVSADWAMFGLARYEQVKKKPLRDLVITVANAYVDALPDEDVDVWPMTFSHIISAQVAAYKLTNENVYLEEARRFAKMAVDHFFQDNPLPRASFKTDHYETITGADSLALSLLEVHAATNHLQVTIPLNTIDR